MKKMTDMHRCGSLSKKRGFKSTRVYSPDFFVFVLRK